MELLEQLAVSFLASASFVVIFNAQKSSLLPGGVTGMASWLIYFMMAVEDDYDPVAASAVASFFVAVISQLFSRRYKRRSPFLSLPELFLWFRRSRI